MRMILAALVALAAVGTIESAHADPYRWCAQYNYGRGGSATNCYFRTFGQCQAAISGVGGYCYLNPFYTGPDERRSRGRRRR